MCPRLRVKSRPQAELDLQPVKLWILLVGVDRYQDSQNLASLKYSALDCQGLGEAFKRSYC